MVELEEYFDDCFTDTIQDVIEELTNDKYVENVRL